VRRTKGEVCSTNKKKFSQRVSEPFWATRLAQAWTKNTPKGSASEFLSVSTFGSLLGSSIEKMWKIRLMSNVAFFQELSVCQDINQQIKNDSISSIKIERIFHIQCAIGKSTLLYKTQHWLYFFTSLLMCRNEPKWKKYHRSVVNLQGLYFRSIANFTFCPSQARSRKAFLLPNLYVKHCSYEQNKQFDWVRGQKYGIAKSNILSRTVASLISFL
jgi:hypothetical protein